MNAPGTQTPGRLAGFKALPVHGGRLQGSIPESKVAEDQRIPKANPLPSLRSPVVVPTGIVQQRTSLLTSKLVAMGTNPHSNDRGSTALTTGNGSKADTTLGTPSNPSDSPLNPPQKQTSQMNRLPSGGIATPTRPLARMMMAPTIFGSSSASASRAPTLPPIRASSVQQGASHREEKDVPQTNHSNKTPKKESDQLCTSTSPPPPSPHSQSGYSPKLLRSPGKSGRLTSVFDTPSKSNGKGFLSSPNRMRGLGLFVSPGKSAPRSPSKTATPRAPVEPVLDEDITPKATLVNPKFRPGSRRPLTELSAMQKEADGGEALMKRSHHRGRYGNREVLPSKAKAVGLGSGVPSVPSGVSTSSEPKISSSTNLSGRSSGDTGSSSAEVWEKVDWAGDTLGSTGIVQGQNGQRLKKKRE
jgi:hypothetical protein